MSGKIKLLFAVFILFYTTLNSFAQFHEERQVKGVFDTTKLRFGGDFWMNFGKSTYINVSPKIGYQLTDRFTPGVGITYQYFRQVYTYSYYYNGATYTDTYLYKTNIYGGSILASYVLLQDMSEVLHVNFGTIVAHAEYNLISVDTYAEDSNGSLYDNGRKWVNRFLVGGGIRQKISPRSSISLLVLWDLIDDSNSPFTNPIFQVGLSL